ncbi:MAG: uroporphyrinogen-III synthase HemD [Pseudomonadota bacterium]|jgi:uroporphyrinogen-III synthase
MTERAVADRLVVLTQPARRAASLAAALRARGADAVEWPLTEIDEVPGFDWQALARTLARCRWALWPSPAAIEVTLGGLSHRGLAWPAGTGLGLIGPGSREALAGWLGRLRGLDAAPVIEPRAAPFDADALLARDELARLDGVEIAVLRRADGREAWLHVLQARGAALHAITVYAARDAGPPPDAAGRLVSRAAADAPACFSVASTDAGARLAAFVATLPCAAWALRQPVLTQHPRIAEALVRQGWQRVITHAPGSDALAAEIESLRRERP